MPHTTARPALLASTNEKLISSLPLASFTLLHSIPTTPLICPITCAAHAYTRWSTAHEQLRVELWESWQLGGETTASDMIRPNCANAYARLPGAWLLICTATP